MALYVLDINEKLQHGKAMKKLLETDPAARLIPMNEFESMEDRVMADMIRQATDGPDLSAKETETLFHRVRQVRKK